MSPFTIFAIHIRMLLSAYFLILVLLSTYLKPIDHLREVTGVLHSACLDHVPNSVYRGEYRTFLCGERLTDHAYLFHESGLIHWLLIYGFQIYIIHFCVRRLVPTRKAQNFLLLIFILLALGLTQFAAPSLRAAGAVFLKELSLQRKFFWSRVQIAIFSGFLCISLEPKLAQNFSLLIAWVASIGFGFLSPYRLWIKNLAIPILISPLVSGLPMAHPFLSFFYSFFSRPILYFLFPFSVLACFEKFSQRVVDTFWSVTLTLTQRFCEILGPIQTEIRLSLIEIWIYMILVMSIFLWLEHRRLK